MPDWKAVLEEIRGLKAEKIPVPKADEPAKAQQPDIESKWWQFTDWFSNQDELLKAILKQLQTMDQVTAPTVPAPPPDYDAPVIPPGLEPAMKLTAQEQIRTRQLLEGFNFVTNQSVVSTPGTPVEVVSTVKTYLVIIRAHTANTGSIYIGGQGVTPQTGYILDAGEAMSIQIDNLKKSIYIDADIAGEGVSWIALVG